MKTVISPQVTQRCLSLFTDIAYATAPAWFGYAGQSMKLSLIIPKHPEDRKNLPLLVWLCGGAFKVMDKDVWLPQLMDFARAGYAVASVQYRTSNDAPFPAQLQDIKGAIRYLRAHADEYGIDPERACVMGESAGGALASLVGVTGGTRDYDTGDFPEQSSAVQAVVNFYGVTDLELAFQTREGPAMQWLGETPEEARKVQDQASAVRWVGKDTPPFLILHGDKDELVDIAQSDSLYETLERNGVPAEYYVLEGRGHGEDAFFQPEIRRIILDFLDKHLRS